jgi:hypothetical protein
MLKPQKRSQRQRDTHTQRDTFATHKEIRKRDKETERENTERNGGTDTDTETHRHGYQRYTDRERRWRESV